MIISKYGSDEGREYANKLEFRKGLRLLNEMPTLKRAVGLLRNRGYGREQRRIVLREGDVNSKVWEFAQTRDNPKPFYDSFIDYMWGRGFEEEQSRELWHLYDAGNLGQVKTSLPGDRLSIGDKLLLGYASAVWTAPITGPLIGAGFGIRNAINSGSLSDIVSGAGTGLLIGIGVPIVAVALGAFMGFLDANSDCEGDSFLGW